MLKNTIITITNNTDIKGTKKKLRRVPVPA